MGQSDISQLEGMDVCGIVYDSDISVDSGNSNPDDNYANLKGATQGLTAFTVTGVQNNGGSALPTITVDLIASDQILNVCQRGQAAPLAGGGGNSNNNNAVYLMQ